MKPYYLRWAGYLLELRQTRYKDHLAVGAEHPHDVCAVVHSKDELRNMLASCKLDADQVDWDSAPDLPSPTNHRTTP